MGEFLRAASLPAIKNSILHLFTLYNVTVQPPPADKYNIFRCLPLKFGHTLPLFPGRLPHFSPQFDKNRFFPAATVFVKFAFFAAFPAGHFHSLPVKFALKLSKNRKNLCLGLDNEKKLL